jgi:uncharacterized protein YneF (UPF0154 family)
VALQFYTNPVVESWWTGWQILIVVLSVLVGITIGYFLYYFIITKRRNEQ